MIEEIERCIEGLLKTRKASEDMALFSAFSSYKILTGEYHPEDSRGD